MCSIWYNNWVTRQHAWCNNENNWNSFISPCLSALNYTIVLILLLCSKCQLSFFKPPCGHGVSPSCIACNSTGYICFFIANLCNFLQLFSILTDFITAASVLLMPFTLWPTIGCVWLVSFATIQKLPLSLPHNCWISNLELLLLSSPILHHQSCCVRLCSSRAEQTISVIIVDVCQPFLNCTIFLTCCMLITPSLYICISCPWISLRDVSLIHKNQITHWTSLQDQISSVIAIKHQLIHE